MAAQPIISSILVNNLKSINRFSASLSLYLTLGPFTKLSMRHSEPLTKLNSKIIPTHMKRLSNLFHSYKVQPPLPFCGIHKPVVIGVLTHLSFTERYAQQGLKSLMIQCSASLNDSIRELNENDLEQRELRSFLIDFRNDLDSKLDIFSNENGKKDIISKTLDWLL